MSATQLDSGRNETALITGASSGIGSELTNLFARDGYDVVLVSRSREKLERFGSDLETEHDIMATVIQQDLSEPNAAEDLYNAIVAKELDINVLVNNAGLPVFGHFSETDQTMERDLIQVNLVSLTQLTKLFVQEMVERGSGRILNNASLAGRWPTPSAAVYGATKAYVISFSVAIAEELNDAGITVTVMCPGETETQFMETGGMEESKIAQRNLLHPRDVAEQGYEGLQNGEVVVVPGGVKQQTLFHLPRLLPFPKAAGIARSYWEGD